MNERPPAAAVSLPPRYVDPEELGRGGMGVVYRVRDVELQRTVAVKCIRAEILANQQIKRRFQREVQAMARVSHENVVRLLEGGEHEGTSYFAMEYLEGRSLRSIIESGERDAPRTVRWFAALADGLAALHEAGILHRDLKPANILVTTGGVPKIMDLGLARLLDEESGTVLTRTGQLVGTLRYLPPEVVQGSPAEPPADVYQLGFILHETLTGKPPYDAPSLAVAARGAGRDAAPPPAGPGIDAGLAALVARAWSAEPARRQQSAAELRDSLRAWLRSRAPGGSDDSLPGAPVDRDLTMRGLAPVRRWEPLAWGAGGAAATAALVAFLLLGRPTGSTPPPGGDPSEAMARVVTAGDDAAQAARDRDELSWAPLHHAVWNGRTAEVEALLDGGSPVGLQDAWGWTPLHLAAGRGHATLVRSLLQRGAAVDAEDHLGETPLHLAVDLGRVDAATLLLDGGALVDRRDRRGRTALHVASRRGREGLVRLLLARRVEVDARDVNGLTPLHMAAYHDHRPVIEALLTARARLDLADHQKRTCVHLCLRGKRPETALYLLAAGAPLEGRDADGNSPLAVAAVLGYQDAVKKMLELGADPWVKNRAGDLPVDRAAKDRHPEAQNVLRAWMRDHPRK